MQDVINRAIELDADIEKVWQALTDHIEFGTWFRVKLDGPFEVGKTTNGAFTLSGHEGVPFWAQVETMEAPHHFSFIWPIDETIAPDDPEIAQKTTLVEFLIEPTPTGARLTVRESGFSRLPQNKRLQLFRDNQEGWAFQTQNLKHYLAS